MSSIWVYPGQGAQKINMLHELPIHKLVKQYLEQASDVLKQDVLLLDQPENLRSNYAVQLCLYLSGIISSALLTDRIFIQTTWPVYQLEHGQQRPSPV